MMHDALRGDALQIVQLARSGDTADVAAVVGDLTAHAAEFTAAIQSNRKRPLPAQV